MKTICDSRIGVFFLDDSTFVVCPPILIQNRKVMTQLTKSYSNCKALILLSATSSTLWQKDFLKILE